MKCLLNRFPDSSVSVKVLNALTEHFFFLLLKSKLVLGMQLCQLTDSGHTLIVHTVSTPGVHAYQALEALCHNIGGDSYYI